MAVGGINDWDLSQYPGTNSAVAGTPRSLDVDVAALINGGSLGVGDALARMTDVATVSNTAVINNRGENEVFTGTKDFTEATTSVDTIATAIAAATGSTLTRAVSINYLKKVIKEALGSWAVANNQTLEFAVGASGTVATGAQAGQYTTAVQSVFDGMQAGQYASGAYNQFSGRFAGQYAAANHLNFRGYQCGQFATGANGVGDGVFAMRFCSGNNSAGYGYLAGNKISSDGNTAIGSTSWNVAPDTPAAVTFASAAINATTQTITVASTAGVGTVGKRYAMRYGTTTGTAPTGFTANTDYSVLVLSATQLQLIDGTITDAGAGTFTLSPFVGRAFTNTTTVGQGSVPTASNEVVLGSPTLTTLTTAATIVKNGVYPSYPDAATANASRAIGELYHLTGSTIVHQRII
jgi:hypothetical protein